MRWFSAERRHGPTTTRIRGAWRVRVRFSPGTAGLQQRQLYRGLPPRGSRPAAEGIPAVTGNASHRASEWIPCYCCGRFFPGTNMVSFHFHPADGLCVRCVEWLYSASRPIVHRLYPIWKLPTRIRRPDNQGRKPRKNTAGAAMLQPDSCPRACAPVGTAQTREEPDETDFLSETSRR